MKLINYDLTVLIYRFRRIYENYNSKTRRAVQEGLPEQAEELPDANLDGQFDGLHGELDRKWYARPPICR